MKRIIAPGYARFIKKQLTRFDDRNTAFSLGQRQGNKYSTMHQNCITHITLGKDGVSIFDHASFAAGATVDYVVRQNLLGREAVPIYNKEYRIDPVDPELMAKIIKDKARWLGADDVGVAQIDERWLYSNWGEQNVRYSKAATVGDPIQLPPEYKYVVVMIHEMGYEIVSHAPDIEEDTDLMYSKGAACASSLATFISELGYRAIPTVNEMGINIAMAVDAGLGEMGRNGQLITPDFGPRVRISKVFTDLPLSCDQPIDIGIQAFCEQCELCAKYCPSQSIPKGERMSQPWDEHNSQGMDKWPVKAMKCLDFWVQNGHHCSVCIRVCPWNKRNNFLHRLGRFFAERNILTPLLIKFDRLLGYGR